MPTNVFVAYADLYLGKQVCRQFASKLHRFTVYGCTWNEDAEELLPHVQTPPSDPPGAADRMCTDALEVALSSNGNHPTGAQDGRDEGARAPASSASWSLTDDAAPSPHTAATTAQTIHHGSLSVGAHDTLSSLSRARDSHCRSMTRYFWRGDIDSVRHALHICDWIVVMMKEAQEVFDMLHCLTHGPFPRKKRMVLLSSFMTWAATPPLFPPPPPTPMTTDEVRRRPRRRTRRRRMR